MKPIRIILFFLLFITLIQCKPKRDPNKTYFDKPSEYNDFIVLEQKKVMNSFDDFANAVNRNNADSMNLYREILSKRAEMAHSSISKLADFKEDTLFRYTALELFKYVNYACNHELLEIIDIATKDSITDTDIERIQDLSEIYTLLEKQKNDALIIAQDNFAKKFNVTVK